MVTLTVTWTLTEVMPLPSKKILAEVLLGIPALLVQWQTGVQLPKQLTMPSLACDGDSTLKQQPAELTVIKKGRSLKLRPLPFYSYV